MSISDKLGHSTVFIEFMLHVIEEALENLLGTQNSALKPGDRISIFRQQIGQNAFSRKDYLRAFKEISPVTASRDLKEAVDNKLIKKTGEKNQSRYTYIN